MLSPTLLHRMCIYAIERNKQQVNLHKRNADMRTFCASLSHDFNGHIRHVSNMIALLKENLQEKADLDPDELTFFRLLEKSTKGVRNLVNDLEQFLTVDHTEEHFQQIDLAELINNLRRQFLETSERKIQILVKDDFPMIRGNGSQMSILFQNLIANGVKYNNENTPCISIEARANQETKRCEVWVCDNGIGIDSKYFQTIFSPFRRLHSDEVYAGTGLGLSIVKRILEKHDSDIRVESEEGTGSKFIVSLPLAS